MGVGPTHLAFSTAAQAHGLVHLHGLNGALQRGDVSIISFTFSHPSYGHCISRQGRSRGALRSDVVGTDGTGRRGGSARVLAAVKRTGWSALVRDSGAAIGAGSCGICCCCVEGMAMASGCDSEF